jgi:queuine tRNA-ribosyltransferase
MKESFFTLEKTSGKARAGHFKTSHGIVETPVFMPVGTRGTIKSMIFEDMESMGAKIILGNTYHLFIRPGHKMIESLGGLHKFSTWDRAILTDSGGYQVFSLAKLNKVTEQGVKFKSHIDGTEHHLTPELSMEIQKSLGSDIVMCFDECPALPAEKKRLEESMQLTLRWAKRSKEVELQPHQHLFGIVQGGLDLELRLECLEVLKSMNFPGLAIGGLSVGEKNEQMYELLQNFVHHMPENKPRYLMGVGKPLDMLKAVKEGVDMFDCVLPTRNARNGGVLTKFGPLNIKNEFFRLDELPLDPTCSCRVCQRYSRAYIRHLFMVGEHSAGQLMSYHNLYFYLDLMRQARKAILEDQFEAFFARVSHDYESEQWRSKSQKES